MDVYESLDNYVRGQRICGRGLLNAIPGIDPRQLLLRCSTFGHPWPRSDALRATCFVPDKTVDSRQLRQTKKELPSGNLFCHFRSGNKKGPHIDVLAFFL